MDEPSTAGVQDLDWRRLGPWWLDELSEDPAYHEEVEPLLLVLLAPPPGGLFLDAGCGQGRLMQALARLDVFTVGCDLNPLLLGMAKKHGPVVRTVLPSLGCFRERSFDGAYVGLVLEHLSDEKEFFLQVARVVRPGGILAIVINHPVWTAPESSPIEGEGGEVLWRPGLYFGRGYSDEPAGSDRVRFYHRTLADLLNAASHGSWDLERLEERGISQEQIVRYPEYEHQEHIPRILGARWRRR